MKLKSILLLLAAAMLVLGLGLGQLFAADKLRLGTAVKLSARLEMAPRAAEKQGIWKKYGLKVDWTAFKGGRQLLKALVADSVDIGIGLTMTFLQGVHRGVPLIAISNHFTLNDFHLWVNATSPLRRAEDIKGVRIAVTRFGGGTYAFGRFVVVKLGLEKEVKFIAAGGGPEKVALLRAGKVEVMITSMDRMMELQAKGVVRSLLKLADYLPRPWSDTVVFARRDFVKASPDVTRRGVKAIIEANNFIVNNPGWSIAEWKTVSRMSEETARMVYKYLKEGLSTDGKLNVKGLENVNRFLVDYKVIRKPKTIQLEQLYTDQFIK